MHHAFRGARVIAAVVATAALASCGGGGGSKAIATGVLAQTCSPNNPYRGDATAPITSGNIGTEKTWLRDYIDRKYLWWDTVPAVNPADAIYSNDTPLGFYDSIDTYFLDLTRPQINPQGKPVDKFSFTYPTAAWDALINSGSTVGYGIEWHFDSPTPPRNIRVSYVHPGSQADVAQIKRGDTLVLADNVAADANTQADVATLNAALFPALSSQHSFRFSRSGVPAADYTFVAGNVTLKSVQSQILNVNGARVGYLLFNDHVVTAEPDLISAFASFSASPGISDLVLDLRYNGGGYLYIASEVAYMIAGAARTANQVFEATMFSNKRSNENSSSGFSEPGVCSGRDFPVHAQRSAAHAQPAARVRAGQRQHVLGQRGHPQRPARRGPRRAPDRQHHLRQALWLLRAGQLRHHLLPDRVPGRQCQGLRQLRQWVHSRRHRHHGRQRARMRGQ